MDPIGLLFQMTSSFDQCSRGGI